MATYSNYSNIKFSTTVIDENIMLNTEIKTSIMRRKGYTEDQQYLDFLNGGIQNLDFMIFTSYTRFSINDISYSEGELLNNKIFVSGDFIRKGIKSIRSESVITDAIFSYNML